MHYRYGHFVGSICHRCLRVAAVNNLSFVFKPSRPLYRHISVSPSIMQGQHSASQLNPDEPRQDESNSNSNNGEKKSRWSNWTGKNAWKTSLVFLTVTFGGSAAALVFSWGR